MHLYSYFQQFCLEATQLDYIDVNEQSLVTMNIVGEKNRVSLFLMHLLY
jgi:hypothetical protein